jgi:hypothetical protein
MHYILINLNLKQIRKIIPVILILTSQFWINGCSPDELIVYKKLSFSESNFKLDNGILNFRDQAVFDSLVRALSEKDSEFLQDWESKLGFKSIRSVYEKAVSEEESFLENLKLKYGDDPNLTREKIGYSDYTQHNLKNQSITLDDYGIVEMNITVPSFGSLLN